ncbi:hypothetical protein N3K66_007827 [Trichothecium roseum]|uniref:Uncharacterized protein n=1 Tax=Trichothecium roseum TaxID=47278 RepID=A0ACC0USV8_9HYPO|nr:hypothetical protein N3K66_007827 [Trichothecium roseum]
MNFTKKIGRARQWAGEKFGAEAKTSQTDEFRMMEAETNLRHEGTERLHKSMNSYVRWMGRRCDVLEDKERSSPIGAMGRAMAAHGEEFEADSALGNSFVAVGQANERISVLQDSLIEQANATWVDNLDRNLGMMKEFQLARKKLEHRRLAYDASLAKLEKARRDDFRVEEEVRTNKDKFEESTEDVFRRMQDIKEAEADSVAAINSFLDAELDYHERCAEELRRARQIAASGPMPSSSYSPPRAVPAGRPRGNSRSSFLRSWTEPRSKSVHEEAEPEPEQAPVRLPSVSPNHRTARPPPPPRPTISRALTAEARQAPRSNAAPPPLPLTRVRTDGTSYGGGRADDVFGDDTSTASGSGSPDYGDGRSLSPATSYGSLSRSAGSIGAARKAPPPPPPNRAKKPAPPVPARKENLGY